MPSVDVEWALELLAQIDRHGRRARRMDDPDNQTLYRDVGRLCLIYGHGAVMDAAAGLWFRADPAGALTVGPAALMLRHVLDGRNGPEREKSA